MGASCRLEEEGDRHVGLTVIGRTRVDETSLGAQSHLLLIAGLDPATQSLGPKRRLDCRVKPGNEGEE
jgi:hypothetical protein